nr:MAG TPA: hypothetical protein [Caudoviricetes sp.]
MIGRRETKEARQGKEMEGKERRNGEVSKYLPSCFFRLLLLRSCPLSRTLKTLYFDSCYIICKI